MNKKSILLRGLVVVGSVLSIGAVATPFIVGQVKHNKNAKNTKKKIVEKLKTAEQQLVDLLRDVEVKYKDRGENANPMSNVKIKDLSSANFEILGLERNQNVSFEFGKLVSPLEIPLANTLTEKPKVDSSKIIAPNSSLIGYVNVHYVAFLRKDGKIIAVKNLITENIGRFIASPEENLNSIKINKPKFTLTKDNLEYMKIAKDYFVNNSNKEIEDLPKFFAPSFTIINNERPIFDEKNNEFIAGNYAYKIIEAKRKFVNDVGADDFKKDKFDITIEVRDMDNPNLKPITYKQEITPKYISAQVKMNNLVIAPGYKLEKWDTNQIQAKPGFDGLTKALPTTMRIEDFPELYEINDASGKMRKIRVVENLERSYNNFNDVFIIGGVEFKQITIERKISKILSSENGSPDNKTKPGSMTVVIENKIAEESLYSVDKDGKKHINKSKFKNPNEVTMETLKKIENIKFNNMYEVKFTELTNSYAISNVLREEMDDLIKKNESIIKPLLNNGLELSAWDVDRNSFSFNTDKWFAKDSDEQKLIDKFNFTVLKIVEKDDKFAKVEFSYSVKTSPLISVTKKAQISERIISRNESIAKLIKKKKLKPTVNPAAADEDPSITPATLSRLRPKEYFRKYKTLEKIRKHFVFSDSIINDNSKPVDISKSQFDFQFISIETINDEDQSAGIINIWIKAISLIEKDLSVDYMVPFTYFKSDSIESKLRLQEIAKKENNINPIISVNATKTKVNYLPKDVEDEYIVLSPKDIKKIYDIDPEIKYEFLKREDDDNKGEIKIEIRYYYEKNSSNKHEIQSINSYKITGFNSIALINQMAVRELKDKLKNLDLELVKDRKGILPSQVKLDDIVPFEYEENTELSPEEKFSFKYVNIGNHDDATGGITIEMEISRGKGEVKNTKTVHLNVLGLGTYRTEIDKIARSRPNIVLAKEENRNTIIPSKTNINDFRISFSDLLKITSLEDSLIGFEIDKSLSRFNDDIGTATISVVLFIKSKDNIIYRSNSYTQIFAPDNKTFTNNKTLAKKILKEFDYSKIDVKKEIKKKKTPQAVKLEDFENLTDDSLSIGIQEPSEEDDNKGMLKAKLVVKKGDIVLKSELISIDGLLDAIKAIEFAKKEAKEPIFKPDRLNKSKEEINVEDLQPNDFEFSFKQNDNKDENGVKYELATSERKPKEGTYTFNVTISKGNNNTTYQVTITGFKKS